MEIRFKPGMIGEIPDGYVTEAKLADSAVTTPKLASDAVTSEKIPDGAIGNTELAADAVTAEKIKDGEVVETKVPPKVFVKTHDSSGLHKVLKHGFDVSSQELVMEVDDTANP